MNMMYAGKITRPPGIGADDPVPIAAHNPLPLHMRVKWVIGGPYKNLATATKWVTIKALLSQADADAIVHLESSQTGDPFTVVNAETGDLDCLIPSSAMDGLTVGTLYYIDVQVLEDGEPYTILYDTIRPYQQVTKAVAAT
jgi:hypothetical protein